MERLALRTITPIQPMPPHRATRSFHCYNMPSVLLQQLGVLGNLDAALQP